MTQMTKEDWAAVRGAQIFERAPEAAAVAVVGPQRPTLVEKGAVLCRQGEPAANCFLVLEGLVKAYREGGDAAAVLAIHGPGRAFLVGEALNGGVYSVTAEAVTRSRILALDAARMRTAIASDQRLARAMLAAAALNLRALVDHIEELKTMTAPARLADFILGLSGARSGAAEVSLPYEKQLIADRLGMTPESFSRALRRLGKHGVSVDREKILIRDVAALRALLT